MLHSFIRKNELALLKSYTLSKKSEWVYVRGRRRIGKTWLLREFQSKNPRRCFYIAGSKGARRSVKLRNFTQEWDRFTGQKNLSVFQTSALDWNFIFREVGTHIKKTGKPHILIFDEIQWLASGEDSFAGDLKSAWGEWQRTNLVKVIVCGSSSKFFRDQAFGEEKILRGLNTRPHLWVVPLTPSEVKAHCFKDWKLQEAALLYMMIGGIPYYLERMEPVKGFVHCINDAFFTLRGHLLDEIDELLNFDFNLAGIKTAKKILACLGQDGSTLANITVKVGLPASTVSELLEKMLDYEVIFARNRGEKVKKNRAGEKYFMKDFFLNFYFQILRKSSEAIRANEKGLIFPMESGLSLQGYYIPNFSGKAFELFMRFIFENRLFLGTPLAEKMLLKDSELEVLDYWDDEMQIDLVIRSNKDRLVRIVECKWAPYNSDWIGPLLRKKVAYQTPFQKSCYIIMPVKPSPALEEQAGKSGVTLLDLRDYYGPKP